MDVTGNVQKCAEDGCDQNVLALYNTATKVPIGDGKCIAHTGDDVADELETAEAKNTRLLMEARAALRERLAHLATLNEDHAHFAVSAQAARTAKALAILDGAF